MHLRHKYKIVKVRQADVYGDGFGGMTALPTGIKTNVYLRCDCGKTKMKRINGHWTKMELEGQ